MRAAVESTRRPGGPRRARRVRRRDRDPAGLSRAGARVLDRRRRHEDGDRRARSRRCDTIGIDLVAMCADDVVCSGAEPLFFLDYVAVGRLDPRGRRGARRRRRGGLPRGGLRARRRRDGRAPGPHGAGRRSTSPGLPRHRRARRPARRRGGARAGDAIVGLPSAGLHANGFSLVRSLLARVLDPARAAVPGAADDDARRRGARRGARGRAGARPARRSARCSWRRPGSTPGASSRLRGALARRRPRPPRARPHHRRRPAGQRAAGAAAGPRRPPRPARWPMPSVMRLVGALGGLEDAELRATFNGGLGMIVVVAPAAARGRSQAALPEAVLAGEVVRRGRELGGRYAEGPLPAAAADERGRSRERPDRGRRLGRRLQPPGARCGRARAASSAARSCWCSPTGRARRSTGRRSRGSTRRSSPGGDDDARRRRRLAARAARPTSSSSPATCASSGRRCSPRSRAGSSTPIRRCCPAFPGAHAVRDALAARREGHRLHRPPRRRDARRRPDRAPGGRPDPAGRRRGDPPRADQGRRAPAPAARRRAAARRRRLGRRPAHGRRRRRPPIARLPVPRRALLSVSDKTGLVELGRGPRRPRLRARVHRRHGASPARGRPAGHRRGAVTGFPEMLDGRVKTLHPRIHAGILADRRLADHRAALARRRRSRRSSSSSSTSTRSRPPRSDPGSRSTSSSRRSTSAARRWSGRRRRTTPASRSSPRPARYEAVLGGARRARRRPARPPLGARGRGVPPHRGLRRADRRGAAVPDGRRRGRRCPPSPACPARRIRSRRSSCSPLEKVETLRYGENPHQPAARYRRTDRRRPRRTARSRPARRRSRARRSRYNNVLDASAAAASRAPLRGPACVDRQAHEPVRRRRAPTLLEAWEAALAGDPVSAFGGVVALTRRGRRRRRRRRSTELFLEVVVAPGVRRRTPSRSSAAKPNLRLVVDPASARARRSAGARDDGLCASTTSARSGRPAAPSSSARRTTAPTIPASGSRSPREPRRSRAARPRPRLAPRPRASSRTRSCSSATGSSSGSAPAR